MRVRVIEPEDTTVTTHLIVYPGGSPGWQVGVKDMDNARLVLREVGDEHGFVMRETIITTTVLKRIDFDREELA